VTPDGSLDAEMSFLIEDAVTDEGDRGYWLGDAVSRKMILGERSP
jgi:hypothetical protein